MGRTKSVPVKFKNCNGETAVQGNSLAHRTPGKKAPHRMCYNLLPPNKFNEQYYLGEISIGHSKNVLPETWTKCKICFITSNDTADMQMEFDSSLIVLVNITNDLTFVKGLVTTKVFAIKFQLKDNHLKANLFFSQFPLQKFNNQIANVIKVAIASTHDIEIENSKDKTKNEDAPEAVEIAQLYRNVKAVQDKDIDVPKPLVQHPLLKPKLRPYQEDAVRWMLLREKEPENAEMMHPLFQELLLQSGVTLFFNKFTGYIDIKKPMVPSLRTGGILADEMGLGKTVEVLACILCSPKTSTPVEIVEKSSVPDIETQSPTVLTRPRKRKKDLEPNDVDDSYVDQPKRLKVPESWVKASSKKSDTHIALEMWYQSKLEEVAISNTPKVVRNVVQCICGETTRKNCVKCIACSKYQHADCLGYKKKFGKYWCPKCWMQQPLLESKATLIVCPVSLRSQWCDEMCKHISKDLKILVYEGPRATPIYPTDLQNYDLVLTTYNVLQNELRLSESGQVLTLRREPRYSTPGSPLTTIKWWRLCLDEAQTVEVPSCMISTMAKKLHAHHRWAITGTPISKDISGLYGLIDYLQLEPYNEFETWNHLLYLPYLSGETKPMLKFLAQVLWRSSKNDVIEQINIPKQTVNEYFLEFSAVEKFYYKCEHEMCANHFLMKLSKYDTDIPLRTLIRGCLNQLLAPLLSIRQACTYPLMKGRYLAPRKQVTSMKELLEALIERNVSESEEHLRIVVSSLNGLAGIYLLLQNPVQAVEEYRSVLQLAARFTVEESEKGISVDKLQLIHTVHNLAEVLETSPPVQPTLRDDTLRQDCLDLQEKYMQKYINQNMTARKESVAATDLVTSLKSKSTLVPGQWYSALLDWALITDVMDDLATRIRILLENANTQKSINFSNGRKLLFLLRVWNEDIDDLRINTITLLNDMYSYSELDSSKFVIVDGLVEAATNCHLRPQKKSKNTKKCLVCKISEHMRQYEAKLFDMTTNKEDISNKGSWKPPWEELALKALLNLARTKSADRELVKDGEIYFSVLEAMKKEFKQLRKFWTYIDQQVCAHDEIEICKTRLSLKEPNAENSSGHKLKRSNADRILRQLSTVLENKLDYVNLVEAHELDYQASVLRNEGRQSMTALEKSLGTYSYLETLRRQQYAGQSPDPCPICKNPLQDEWSILICGHCYCLECIQLLLEKTCSNRIPCSICRQVQKIDDISYIRSKEEVIDQGGFSIKGNYSTKVEAVVKLVLELRNEDQNVKILVFSTWLAVLKILQTALNINDVTAELMLPGNLKNTISRFKDPNKHVTVLLLPVHLGSKGLNLIEATHVVLVEPLLNPGDELQAIGRVHRIGQTKPTSVHKFIVKHTIEESIHHATSLHADVWDKNKITIQQLKDLFVDIETETIEENMNEEPTEPDNEATASTSTHSIAVNTENQNC